MPFENLLVVGIAVQFFSVLFNDVLRQSSKTSNFGWGWTICRYCISPATLSRGSFFLPLPFFSFFFFLLPTSHFWLDFSDFWDPAAWVQCNGHVRCSSNSSLPFPPPQFLTSQRHLKKVNYKLVTAPVSAKYANSSSKKKKGRPSDNLNRKQVTSD